MLDSTVALNAKLSSSRAVFLSLTGECEFIRTKISGISMETQWNQKLWPSFKENSIFLHMQVLWCNIPVQHCEILYPTMQCTRLDLALFCNTQVRCFLRMCETSVSLANKYPANRECSGKVLSSNNVNRTSGQSSLVFNNVLKTAEQKCYLYIAHGTFLFTHTHGSLCLSNFFINVTTCFRTFREHSKVTFS